MGTIDERFKWGDDKRTKEMVEELNLSRQRLDKLRAQKLKDAFVFLQTATAIVRKGGNIHRVNQKKTRKRRARSKMARDSRRANR